MNTFIMMKKYMYTLRFNIGSSHFHVFIMKHNYIQVMANYGWYNIMKIGSSSCPSVQVHVHWFKFMFANSSSRKRRYFFYRCTTYDSSAASSSVKDTDRVGVV